MLAQLLWLDQASTLVLHLIQLLGLVVIALKVYRGTPLSGDDQQKLDCIHTKVCLNPLPPPELPGPQPPQLTLHSPEGFSETHTIAGKE